ncbi:hypothetical protein TWF718_003061 [Orbilia javanica]|uniref:Uncharacterized protein n=1 Tax=Orbilia javanica TaxID=47235 RepID=A0AAN8MPH9_9PEZI
MAEIKEATEATKSAMKVTKNEPIKSESKDNNESPPEPAALTTNSRAVVAEPEGPKSTSTSPANSFKENEQIEKTPPSIAMIDRMRAREDIPVEIDPKTIGKIRSPNFAQFRTGLGGISAKKVRDVRKDLEMSGTPNHTPTKNRYAPTVERADFELDICAKIGAIQWDSDDD